MKTLESLIKHFFKNKILDHYFIDDIPVVKIDIKYLRDSISKLITDKDLKFTILSDITSVDYPNREQRFEMIYNLLSIYKNYRIIIKCDIGDTDKVPTISDLYKAACWYEREIWDMFGIVFEGHNDLRRILSDYDFDGHALRKDFPLTGYKEVHYDKEKKSVIYDDVKLTQEYRKFDFISPWEGAHYEISKNGNKV